MLKKIARAPALLEANPPYPGLHLERIANDPTAWSARLDGRYRLSFDPRHPAASRKPGLESQYPAVASA